MATFGDETTVKDAFILALEADEDNSSPVDTPTPIPQTELANWLETNNHLDQQEASAAVASMSSVKDSLAACLDEDIATQEEENALKAIEDEKRNADAPELPKSLQSDGTSSPDENGVIYVTRTFIIDPDVYSSSNYKPPINPDAPVEGIPNDPEAEAEISAVDVEQKNEDVAEIKESSTAEGMPTPANKQEEPAPEQEEAAATEANQIEREEEKNEHSAPTTDEAPTSCYDLGILLGEYGASQTPVSDALPGKAPTRENCQTTFQNCRAKNPLFCRFHGPKLLELDFVKGLRSVGFHFGGKVSVSRDESSTNPKQFKVTVACYSPEEADAAETYLDMFLNSEKGITPADAARPRTKDGKLSAYYEIDDLQVDKPPKGAFAKRLASLAEKTKFKQPKASAKANPKAAPKSAPKASAAPTPHPSTEAEQEQPTQPVAPTAAETPKTPTEEQPTPATPVEPTKEAPQKEPPKEEPTPSEEPPKEEPPKEEPTQPEEPSPTEETPAPVEPTQAPTEEQPTTPPEETQAPKEEPATSSPKENPAPKASNNIEHFEGGLKAKFSPSEKEAIERAKNEAIRDAQSYPGDAEKEAYAHTLSHLLGSKNSTYGKRTGALPGIRDDVTKGELLEKASKRLEAKLDSDNPDTYMGTARAVEKIGELAGLEGMMIDGSDILFDDGSKDPLEGIEPAAQEEEPHTEDEPPAKETPPQEEPPAEEKEETPPPPPPQPAKEAPKDNKATSTHKPYMPTTTYAREPKPGDDDYYAPSTKPKQELGADVKEAIKRLGPDAFKPISALKRDLEKFKGLSSQGERFATRAKDLETVIKSRESSEGTPKASNAPTASATPSDGKKNDALNANGQENTAPSKEAKAALGGAQPSNAKKATSKTPKSSNRAAPTHNEGLAVMDEASYVKDIESRMKSLSVSEAKKIISDNFQGKMHRVSAATERRKRELPRQEAEEVQRFIAAAIPSVVSQCPGLEKAIRSLTFTTKLPSDGSGACISWYGCTSPIDFHGGSALNFSTNAIKGFGDGDSQMTPYVVMDKAMGTTTGRYRIAFMHELGHSLMRYKSAMQAFLKADEEASKKDKKWYTKVSFYARLSKGETHSEALANYTRPGYKKGSMPKPIEDYFANILEHGPASDELSSFKDIGNIGRKRRSAYR